MPIIHDEKLGFFQYVNCAGRGYKCYHYKKGSEKSMTKCLQQAKNQRTAVHAEKTSLNKCWFENLGSEIITDPKEIKKIFYPLDHFDN